jgi:muramidase (phage lysozyme)
MFGFQHLLTNGMKQELLESAEYKFYELIFCNIREEDFACLYSTIESRPNAPVNCLVGALLLMARRRWSYSELFQQIRFDLLTKTALGLQHLDEMPFIEATIFNFQNRLNDYFADSGNNLLEKAFDGLTARQMRELGIKSDIQRADSFQAGSNIRNYTRLQLLVEMLIRVHRVLTEEDKQQFAELFAPYVAKTSGKYIYSLTPDDLPGKLEEIGRAYNRIATEISPRYAELGIFATFNRVYAEHFTVVNEAIVVRPNVDMTSDSLQSPDDEDATYRKKGNKEHRGQVVNIVETANPDNKLNLIVDVAVDANNVDDGQMLNERFDGLKAKTPALNELHTDGGYPSEDNDVKCRELGITMVQTGIRGAKSDGVEIIISQDEQQGYTVACPGQTVVAQKTRSRHKAQFDATCCAKCPLAVQCKHASGRYYFTDKDYQRKQRQANIKHLPPERRTLRPNVEASVREFKRAMENGKLKVRGRFKTVLFAFTRAVSINFGRIARYLDKVGAYILKNGRLCPVHLP